SPPGCSPGLVIASNAKQSMPGLPRTPSSGAQTPPRNAWLEVSFGLVPKASLRCFFYASGFYFVRNKVF
ncbi:hypothetical protein IKQ19_07225, partial [Candidatus Saccharibacteria bacterium]|nr:hypothetical protein [Candidatus Saccharibacteria bacterium]